MSPRVYHTAHIRRRLTRMTVTGLIGLAIAAAAAGSSRSWAAAPATHRAA